MKQHYIVQSEIIKQDLKFKSCDWKNVIARETTCYTIKNLLEM